MKKTQVIIIEGDEEINLSDFQEIFSRAEEGKETLIVGEALGSNGTAILQTAPEDLDMQTPGIIEKKIDEVQIDLAHDFKRVFSYRIPNHNPPERQFVYLDRNGNRMLMKEYTAS